MAELSSVYDDIHDRIWEIEKVNRNLNERLENFLHLSTYAGSFS